MWLRDGDGDGAVRSGFQKYCTINNRRPEAGTDRRKGYLGAPAPIE